MSFMRSEVPWEITKVPTHTTQGLFLPITLASTAVLEESPQVWLSLFGTHFKGPALFLCRCGSVRGTGGEKPLICGWIRPLPFGSVWWQWLLEQGLESYFNGTDWISMGSSCWQLPRPTIWSCRLRRDTFLSLGTPGDRVLQSPCCVCLSASSKHFWRCLRN